MTGCPELSFSCSNISCSIWFCGGSNKEHEREQNKPQQPAAPNPNNPQPSPPQLQVITVPDHPRKPSPVAVAAETPPPVQVIPPPPPSLQTPTLAAPPKVHDPSWTQTTTQITHPVPVWSQTQNPTPSVPDMQMQIPHMQIIPASHVHSAEMVHKQQPPPRSAPARQPSKTYHQTTMPPRVNQHYPTHSHLPSESYYDDDDEQAAALPVPDGVGYSYYPHQEHWE